MKKIYTIGYEGKDIDRFLELLEKSGIEQLIDVRSHPKSKKEKFSKQNLKKELVRKNVKYEHMPELGGLGKENYKEKMKSEKWVDAFNDVKEIAKQTSTVLMCLEKDPMKCHRRFIVDRLQKDGWEVVHIGRGRKWKGKKLEDF